jgi:hypothetical protein
LVSAPTQADKSGLHQALHGTAVSVQAVAVVAGLVEETRSVTTERAANVMLVRSSADAREAGLNPALARTAIAVVCIAIVASLGKRPSSVTTARRTPAGGTDADEAGLDET